MFHFDGCPQDWATLISLWQYAVDTFNWTCALAHRAWVWTRS